MNELEKYKGYCNQLIGNLEFFLPLVGKDTLSREEKTELKRITEAMKDGCKMMNIKKETEPKMTKQNAITVKCASCSTTLTLQYCYPDETGGITISSAICRTCVGRRVKNIRESEKEKQKMTCDKCGNYEPKKMTPSNTPPSLHGIQECSCENFKEKYVSLFTAHTIKDALELKEKYRKRVEELEAKYEPEEPEVHPLDKMISDIISKELERTQIFRGIHDLSCGLKKLRYESMMWMFRITSPACVYPKIDDVLRKEGREDWIVE